MTVTSEYNEPVSDAAGIGVRTLEGLDAWHQTGDTTALALPPGDVGYRRTTTGGHDLTGIVAGSGYQFIHIFNDDTSDDLKLKNEDTASAAANRLRLADDSNFDLKPYSFVTLQYDPVSSRWTQVGQKT